MPETAPHAPRRTFLLSLAAAIPCGRLLLAQERDATFSTDVSVVSVLVTVRDKQSRIVSTLNKEDFALAEDGRAQVVKYFSRETDLPLTLGLLVDTSLSQRAVLGQEKDASFRFLDKVLRAEKDKTFVMHFDHESELLQDLTASRTDLRRALDELELPAEQRPQMSRRGGGSGGGYPGSGGGGIGFPGGGIGFPGGRRGGRGMGRPQGGGRQGHGAGTTLYDAIYLGSGEIMKKQTGRKALILLTDGVDNGSKTFLNDAIESAQRADTLVYSILFSDAQAYKQPFGGPARDGKKVLQQISRETGGSFYEVSKKLSIDEIYDRLQTELRNQYSLGYSSGNSAPAGLYRTIKVTVKQPGFTVQSREGYYRAAR